MRPWHSSKLKKAEPAWFTDQPEETGIVQRFGKVMRAAGPGLHFKLPCGVEKVYERMISERKRVAAQFRSEGEGRRAEILGTIEKELRHKSGNVGR